MSTIWKALDTDKKSRDERNWKRCQKFIAWLDGVTKPFQK